MSALYQAPNATTTRRRTPGVPNSTTTTTGGLFQAASQPQSYSGQSSITSMPAIQTSAMLSGNPTPTVANPNQNENVASNMASIVNQGSPVMNMARADGMRAANRRGLMNSSMGVGAAQEAVLRTALPMAQQQAQQGFQANQAYRDYTQNAALQDRDITSRESMQGRDLTSREFMQGRDLASRSDLLNRELDSREFMQGRDITSAEMMQGRDLASRRDLLDQELSSREFMQGRDITSQEFMQGRDLTSRTDLLNRELANRMDMLTRELQSLEGRQGVDINARRTMLADELDSLEQRQAAELSQQREIQMRELDIRDRLGQMGLNAEERDSAARTVISFEQLYQNTVNTINNNPDIPADARQTMLTAARNLRDVQMNLAEQLYAIDLDF